MAGNSELLQRIPWDDPAAFLEFVERHSGEIGSRHNDWLFIVQGALASMRRSDSPRDRESYRNVVLVATRLGNKATSGRRFTRWLELSLRVRAIYLGRSDKGKEWNDQEAESMYDDFTAAVGLDAHGMSEFLAGKRVLPFEVDPMMMSDLAVALRYMEKLIPLLPPAKRRDLEHWVSIRDQIGRWHGAPR